MASNSAVSGWEKSQEETQRRASDAAERSASALERIADALEGKGKVGKVTRKRIGALSVTNVSYEDTGEDAGGDSNTQT